MFNEVWKDLNMLSVEKVDCREGFVNLESEWNSLLQRSESDTIALTHQWLLTWWDIFGEGRELHILIVRDAAEIIGIAPLLKRRVLNLGLPFQRLEFLASGENEADEICSDYLDFILLRGRENEVLQAIFDFLQDENGWDEMLLRELSSSSPSALWLEKLDAKTGLKCEFTPDGEAVYLPLPDKWDTLLASFDRRVRSKLRQDCERLNQLDSDLQIFDAPLGFATGFDFFVQLHQQLWISRGESGVFASEKFTRFHRELTRKLLPLKQVRLFVLSFEGKPLTALYAFFYNQKAFFYQSGQAPGGPFQSPGTLLQNLAIQHAISEGLREWDFLKAEPGSYKYRWSKQTRAIVQARVAKTQLKEAVLTSTNRVVNRLRQVKRSLKR